MSRSRSRSRSRSQDLHRPSPRPLPRRRSAALLAVVSTVATVALTGCQEDAEPPRPRDSAAKVIQPGGPGEEASTLAPGATAEHAEHAHADVAFMQMMIPHHEQALTMSELARTRAASPQVKALARRVSAAQRPEILTMAAWLADRDIAVPSAEDDPADYDHGEHGHATMHGMLTAAQMRELEAARGPEFDRLFLRGMIQHHRGAIAMADVVATEGADVQVAELAGDIVVGQGAEIDRMRSLLADL